MHEMQRLRCSHCVVVTTSSMRTARDWSFAVVGTDQCPAAAFSSRFQSVALLYSRAVRIQPDRHVAWLEAAEMVAAPECDWPDWQIWVVHRVVGGTLWCARRWDGTGRVVG